MYEMIYGVPPFYNKNQNVMLNWIVTIDPFFPKMISISHELKDLISQCLKKKPEERIGYANTEDIKKHEFFQDINWEEMEQKKYDPPIKPSIKGKLDLQNFNKKYSKQRYLKSSSDQETPRLRDAHREREPREV